MYEEMERKRLLEPVKTKKSKKRKAEESEQPPAKKRPLPNLNPSISAASRAVVSEIAMEEAKRKSTMTDTVKSLYGEGVPKRKETFMTMSTFTRVSMLLPGFDIC